MNSLRELSGEHPTQSPNEKLLRTYEGMMKLTLQTALESASRLSNTQDQEALVQALKRFSNTQDSSILYAPIREGGPKLATVLYEATGKDRLWRDLSELILDIRKLKDRIPASGENNQVSPTSSSLRTGTGDY